MQPGARLYADAREPRPMRPHLRPAGPAGRRRQRGPHPAACRFRPSCRHQRSSPAWRCCSAPKQPSSSQAGW